MVKTKNTLLMMVLFGSFLILFAGCSQKDTEENDSTLPLEYDMKEYWPMELGNTWYFSKVGSLQDQVEVGEPIIDNVMRISEQQEIQGYIIWKLEQSTFPDEEVDLTYFITYGMYEDEEYCWISRSEYEEEEILSQIPPDYPQWLPVQPRDLRNREFKHPCDWHITARVGPLKEFFPLQIDPTGTRIEFEYLGDFLKQDMASAGLYISQGWETPRDILVHHIGPAYFFPFALQKAVVDGNTYE